MFKTGAKTNGNMVSHMDHLVSTVYFSMVTSASCAETIQTPFEAITIGQLDQNLRKFSCSSANKKGENTEKMNCLLAFTYYKDASTLF